MRDYPIDTWDDQRIRNTFQAILAVSGMPSGYDELGGSDE